LDFQFALVKIKAKTIPKEPPPKGGSGHKNSHNFIFKYLTQWMVYDNFEISKSKIMIFSRFSDWKNFKIKKISNSIFFKIFKITIFYEKFFYF